MGVNDRESDPDWGIEEGISEKVMFELKSKE